MRWTVGEPGFNTPPEIIEAAVADKTPKYFFGVGEGSTLAAGALVSRLIQPAL